MTDTVPTYNGARVWRISELANAVRIPIKSVYAFAKDHQLEIVPINNHNYLYHDDVLRAASPLTVYTALHAHEATSSHPPGWPSSPFAQPVVPKKDDVRINQLKKAISGLLDAVYTKGEINYHPFINEKINEWTAELRKLEGN